MLLCLKLFVFCCHKRRVKGKEMQYQIQWLLCKLLVVTLFLLLQELENYISKRVMLCTQCIIP